MKRRLLALGLALCLALTGTACKYVDQAMDLVKEVTGGSSSASEDTTPAKSWQQTVEDTVTGAGAPVPPDDGVRSWYQVYVYSFVDSDADGVGDLNGLSQQLDYIRYLGFNGLWLMPINPAGAYDKSDVTDYYSIDIQYGTMAHFDSLLAACSSRGIDVMLELPVQTSSQHGWFTKAVAALAAENTKETTVGYYYFSQEDGGEGWYEATEGWWYYASGGEGKPDLDLTNTALRGELEKVMRFWLDKGVSALRVDVGRYYDAEDNTTGNGVLKWLEGAAKDVRTDALMFADMRQGDTAYRAYYASGVDGLFNTPFAGAGGVLAQAAAGGMTGGQYAGTILEARAQIAEAGGAHDAVYLTDHDTDRAAGFLEQDENRQKLALGLSLLQGGSAFMLYGEELGMSGSGSGENRCAPMYWSSIPGVFGMSVGPAGMETQTQACPPAMEQIVDEGSVLNYVRRANTIRSSYPAIARGDVAAVELGGTVGLVKTTGEQSLLVVYNLGAENVEVSLPGDFGGATLADQLSVSTSAATLEGGTLKLPGYGIAVLEIAGYSSAEGDDSAAE